MAQDRRGIWYEATFFDGVTPVDQAATFRVEDDTTRIVIHVGDASLNWPLSDLRAPAHRADEAPLVLNCGYKDARLVVRDPDGQAVLERLAHRLRKAPPVASRLRYLAWGTAAIASVFLSYFVLLPRMSAALTLALPQETADELAENALSMLREYYASDDGEPARICSTPAGDAALVKLMDRLIGDIELPHGFNATVIDASPMNAMGQPGGQMTLMNGIFRIAETPEQLAGALAHELGHLYHEHATTRTLRRSASTGILELTMGEFTGGEVVAGLSQRLIFAEYSRENERIADEFAREVLVREGIPLSAMSELFAVLMMFETERTGVAKYLETHPGFGERIAATNMATGMKPAAAAEPLLTEDEWSALRSICE
ncbi:M48 family metallopeptidase [Aestuariibius sp. 2305UL40-4]|uniref:M48 family metallopeptidase n=1 Tax=Aestuariibius violaceus TaxID=3234132 RepID=UPI00345E7D17